MSAKRVVTISERELPIVAQLLLDRMADTGFVPDAAIGIATGGALVVSSLPKAYGIAQFTCTMQRPSTATKKRATFGRRILKKMPYQVTNRLRLLEARIGERSIPVVPDPPPSLEHTLDVVVAEVREQGLQRLAVIDDAVDSGATLACVLRALARRLPAEVTIRTGAITRTRRPQQTAAQPDFVIFEDTLCRFHWSYDYKGPS